MVDQSSVGGQRYRRHGPVRELIRAEQQRPERLLLRWAGGDLTVAQFAALARRCAVDLQSRFGVKRGDRVAIVGGNSVLRLAWQYGAYWIGAVEVSVNFELKGPMLRYILTDSAPALILADEEFLAEVAAHGSAQKMSRIDHPHASPAAVDAAELDRIESSIAPEELATILYTSGTTGPSKGVMLPRAYFANHADSVQETLALADGDIGYFVLPFFHVDAHIVFPAAIASGSALAFNRRFSVSRFWDEAETFGCTWAFVIGSVLSAVATVPHPEPTTISLTRFLGAPIPIASYEYFEERLGIRILSMYGQTEADGPTFETISRRKRGSAGVVCDAFELAIIDRSGERVAPGQTGEICHRPRYPNMLMLGYWNRPDATVESWRNLWFHTGDLGYVDEDGFLFYSGRMTDSLRRRGENISAYELEAVIRDAPGIEEAAAIAVVDELGGEDEIKVIVTCSGAEVFDPREFFTYCEHALPRFAVPRFVEVVAPQFLVRSVGTGVIQKHRLSRDVSGPEVIDRLSSGDARQA